MTEQQEEPKRYQQFRVDMERAGYKVVDYAGRFYYKGPAVYTSRNRGPSVQDVIRATHVKVQTDNMGRDYVVYPA